MFTCLCLCTTQHRLSITTKALSGTTLYTHLHLCFSYPNLLAIPFLYTLSFCKWTHTVSHFLRLAFPICYSTFMIHLSPFLCQLIQSFSLLGNSHGSAVPQWVNWKTSRLFVMFPCWKWCCYECCSSDFMWLLISLRWISNIVIGLSYGTSFVNILKNCYTFTNNLQDWPSTSWVSIFFLSRFAIGILASTRMWHL